jgi:hypothetical protein
MTPKGGLLLGECYNEFPVREGGDIEWSGREAAAVEP